MKLIDLSLRNSTGVLVGMILTILFGYLAFQRIPIQLNPTIESPFITVQTLYPGAAAIEVEQEITQRQEEKLAAVENLREMRSTSTEGQAEITLKFDWGVNKDLALIDVLQKLNLVEEMPDDVEEPQILTVNRRDEEIILWISTYLAEGVNLTINEQRRIVDDLILPQLERVQDVAGVRRYGGAEREIHVLVDLQAMTARQLSLNEVAAALNRENRNLRGGKIDAGTSRLIVRSVGQFSSLDQIESMVVKYGDSGPIRIRDIGRVIDASKDIDFYVRVNGRPTIAMGVIKQTGANTLETTERVKETVRQLNKSLEVRGISLRIAYDASEYIWDSIYQVRDNLIVGGILATAILWLFLRSVASTLIVGITIPLCTVGTFVLLAAFGRSVNVISLAGLAFASGMVVDNGIVVIENIYRHRTEMGKSILLAARDASVEVWAPIVASTLTTLAVFVPVLFIQEEAGQLFRDIAYSISFAVALSMFSSITVVPMLASRWLGRLPVHHHRTPDENGSKLSDDELDLPDHGFKPAIQFHRMLDPFIMKIGHLFSRLFIKPVELGLNNRLIRYGLCLLIFLFFLGSFLIVPPAEYLPTGNRNFVLGMIKLPAGMSLEGSDRIMKQMEARVREIPELERTFFVILRDMPIFGVIIKKDLATKETVQRIVGELTEFATNRFPFPDIIPIIFQVPVFGGMQGGKSVTVDISGPDLRKLQELTDQISDRIRTLPGIRMVRPSLDLGNPELQVLPNRERLADLGLTTSDIAEVVETLVEGRITSLYREGGKEYDLKLKALEGQIREPKDLALVSVTTPSGEKVKLADVARLEKRLGPVAIERLEQERSSSLQVTVEETFALETVIDEINQLVINPILEKLPYQYQIRLSGSADDLARTVAALSGSFILALVIIYLLMASLFRSFIYPFLILFSVPLAMTGAFLGITLRGAEFNVISMIGFILLAGVVVNNAILLVDVTLNQVREGATHNEAILEAVRRRIRPIFMTSITSVLGMLPLALGRGAGAELYSGLGIAVVGGLSISTLFTLILIPMLLKMFLGFRDGLAKFLGHEEWTEREHERKLEELDKIF